MTTFTATLNGLLGKVASVPLWHDQSNCGEVGAGPQQEAGGNPPQMPAIGSTNAGSLSPFLIVPRIHSIDYRSIQYFQAVLIACGHIWLQGCIPCKDYLKEWMFSFRRLDVGWLNTIEYLAPLCLDKGYAGTAAANTLTIQDLLLEQQEKDWVFCINSRIFLDISQKNN